VFGAIRIRSPKQDVNRIIERRKLTMSITNEMINSFEKEKLRLAVEMLRECDRWAVQALTAYVHKLNPFDTQLNSDNVLDHQEKIRNVIRQISGGQDI